VDVDEWLSEAFATPDGRAWDGLRGGRIAAGPGADDIPGCGNGATTSYKDLTQFVAFYCPIGDVVVLDDGPNGLLEQLSRDHGPSAAAVVLAHEYGHALQDRLRLLDGRIPTILLEQQADCVAGAWTGRAARDGSTVLRLDQGDVRTALIAILNVRDPAGVDQFDEGGHGSGFDRIGAFQVGFESGLDTCLTLIDQPLDLMPNQFLSVDDMLRGGNAPYDCALDPNPECSPSWEFLGSDLEEFWSIVIGEPVGLTARPSLDGTTCSEARRIVDQVTLCPGEVVFGQPPVLAAYEQVGDFVLGYLLGLGWVEEVLTRIGSPATGLERALLTDCLIGAWVDDITLGLDRAPERASTVATSPGDLDEALAFSAFASLSISRATPYISASLDGLSPRTMMWSMGAPSCPGSVDEVVVDGGATLPSKDGRLSRSETSSGSWSPFHTSTLSPRVMRPWKYSEMCIGIRTQPCEAGSRGTLSAPCTAIP
ncbi:MAG: hypothetical protein EBV88_07555, partial [Actinobacteria bacterium]|nr:hypothetical protein [Actinomycetota bacterium]